jgi:hypothetical protein
VITALRRADPLAVARGERERRQALGFPPAGGLAALRGEAVAVARACDALRGEGLTVLGPVDDGSRALVKAATWSELSDALATPAVDGAHGVGRLRVDVDPRRDA